MQSQGIPGLIIASLSVALVALAIPFAEPQAARSSRLCGVEFRNGAYEFSDSEQDPHAVVLSRRAPRVERDPDTVVMRLDAPADGVDFVARAAGEGGGRLVSELVAYDAQGRVVDRDTGPAASGEDVTMQVTTDAPVIRELRFRFHGVARGSEVEIRELEIASAPEFCLLAS